MFKKRSLAIFVTLMLVGTIFAGCGKKDDAKAAGTDTTKKAGEFTVYTYYADSAKKIVDETVRLMKEKYPDVTLKIEHRADSDGAVLKTRASVGELPDIFECTGTLTDIFIKSKDILPLDEDMTKMDFENLFVDKTFEGMKSPDGHYYAIQASPPQSFVLYYNKKVFADNNITPPKNYPEFLAIVKKLRAAGIIPLSLFAAQKWPGLQLFDLAVVSQEPLGISGFEGGVKKPSDKAYTDAANKISELVNAGLIGKGAFSTNASQAFELFKTGKAAMVGNGSWFFNDSQEYADNVGIFEVNPFADPGTEEASKWNVSGGVRTPSGYSVSAKGKDPTLAKELALNYVICRARAAVTETSDINVLKEDVQPKAKRSEVFQQYAVNAVKFKTFTKFEWGLKTPELITLLEDSVEKLMTNTYPPDKFLKDLEKNLADTPK